MSDPPSGAQCADNQSVETIDLDRAQRMQVGDKGTQSNTFTHISADDSALLRQETEAGRDAYIAGRDQYLTHPEAPKPCGCGKDSTGGCIKCKRRVCDKHGLMVHGKFLCIPCHREMIKAERTALLPVESTRGREIGSTAPASADGGADSYKSYQSHYVAYKPNVEGIMFNLEPPYGGLVIYADYTWRGLSLRVQWEYEGIRRPNLIANVVMRKIDGNYEYAAVFSQVYQGNWVLPLDEGSIDFTVWPRQIAEVDLRVNR